jgi:hypothetical protein
MSRFAALLIAMLSMCGQPGASVAGEPNNLILFVPDGLRSAIVDATTAPTLATLRAEGVDFRNSHALFPTFTTANAAAFATGHGLGDTGDFSNFIYSGFPVTSANSTTTPFLESNAILRQVNSHFGGNYLNEQAIVAAAREQGYATAVLGKLGPAAIFDLPSIDGAGTLIIDDASGTPGQEVPLSKEWQAAFARARVSTSVPSRGDNGNAGSGTTAGTWVPGLAQQQYFLEVLTKVVLPQFKAGGKPFVIVYWSRDPDGTQHNQGDSFLRLNPGINGPTSLAAIGNADLGLKLLQAALRRLNLTDTTNIVVAADHGFSTIRRSGSSSPAAAVNYTDVPAGHLPPGFLAIDLLESLQHANPRLQLFDPDDAYRAVDWRSGRHSLRGNGVIAESPDRPEVVVAANGGSDLIYLPSAPTRSAKRPQAQLARRIAAALLERDYVSGVFVDADRFGDIPGALSTRAIGIGGGLALTPHPALVVNFASSPIEGCTLAAVLCTATFADTGLQQGQGMHGSLSRSDTWNFMAARGPDFRRGFVDPLPASNADIGMTIAQLLYLDIKAKGPLGGRVLAEALVGTMPGMPLPLVSTRVLQSQPGRNGQRTILRTQSLGTSVYLDMAGFPGRTVGLAGD